jgi:hypothetical protein
MKDEDLGGMRLQVSILLLNLVIRPSSQVPLHLNLGRGCGRLAPPPNASFFMAGNTGQMLDW